MVPDRPALPTIGSHAEVNQEGDARGQADAARNDRGTVNRHDPQPRTRCPAEWSAFGPARCGKRIRSAPGLR
jgi:hypothetical protein